MKMKFSAVPHNCRIAYKVNGKLFEGIKVGDDMAYSRRRGTYMLNIPADEQVCIVFKAPWRVRLLLLQRWFTHAEAATKKLMAHLSLSKLAGRCANYGLTSAERYGLSSEAAPLLSRVETEKLQRSYDAAFNIHIGVTSTELLTPSGLLKGWMDDKIPMVTR